MFLTKGGITIEVASPIDIKRYLALGFVEPKIGYPAPEMVVDGEKTETQSEVPPVKPPAQKPDKPPAVKASARKEKPQAAKSEPDEKAVNDEP